MCVSVAHRHFTYNEMEIFNVRGTHVVQRYVHVYESRCLVYFFLSNSNNRDHSFLEAENYILNDETIS